MKKMSLIKSITTSLLLVVVMVVLSSNKAQSQNAKVAVIVSKENPVDKLDEGKVKLYYLRKVNRRWPDFDKNIKPVDRSDNASLKKKFISEVLGMTADELERYFIESQYRNAIPPPPKLSSDAEVIQYIKDNVGALGYVSQNAVTNDVKVILILD